jgi:hypothetical protein
MTKEEKIEHLVASVEHMTLLGYSMYFGKRAPEVCKEAGLTLDSTIEEIHSVCKDYARKSLESGGFDLEIIYDDAKGNGDLIDLSSVTNGNGVG